VLESKQKIFSDAVVILYGLPSGKRRRAPGAAGAGG
jgi:hypothetical protein